MSFLSGTIRCSGLILYISCSSPAIKHFCKEPWSLLLEDGIRNQDLSTRCVCCYCGLLANRGRRYMWTYYLVYITYL
jgi:hypothetical protein